MAAVFIRTLIIYLLLIITMRLMGKRQIGELEVSELIITFMLSELATIPLTDTDIPLLYGIIPILLLLSLEVILTFMALKFSFIKKVIYGKPNVLIKKGVLDQQELLRQRISLGELLCAARQNGISSLDDIYYAILEENGKISIFPKAEKSPVVAEDLGLMPTEDGLAMPLVIDGKIIEENLRFRNWSTDDLYAQLKSRRIVLSDVLLLTADDKNNIKLIKRNI